MAPPLRFDFSLRTNKVVERKLIFEAFAVLGDVFRWREYQYIGLGCLWFRDFLMAHRALGIRRMHSIEGVPSLATRAKRNRPLHSIEIHAGRASAVLGTAALGMADHRGIVWLDYDDSLSKEELSDLERCCRDLPPGSALLATFNASAPGLAGSQTTSEPMADDADAAFRKILALRADRLRELFGDWVPASPPLDYFSVSKLDRYPMRIAQLIWGFCTNTVAARSNVQLVPLFNFAYRDNAPMITIGGMIVDEQDAAQLEASRVRRRVGVLRSDCIDLSAGWPMLVDQCRIEVPVITRLEQLRLNSALPGAFNKRKIQSLFGASLDREERAAYRQFYNYVPAFAEFEL